MVKDIRSVAITTYFRHHAAHGGYAQILQYTKPVKVFGIDENTAMPSRLRQKYQWLYELDAASFAKKNNIDVIHILYGEDYHRFSHLVAGKVPVIATFHQPAAMLEQDVKHGDLRGRIGGITHFFSKSRYRKLAAAIVLSSSQKEVLKQVMPEEKIIVIPHGVELGHYREQAAKQQVQRDAKQVLTVGQWMRDWDFYFRFLEYCREKNNWQFHLVNRTLPAQYKAILSKYSNLVYHDSINDAGLTKLYMQCGAQFLPVLQAAANNAVVESFALGCPVVMTDVVHDDFYEGGCLTHYRKEDLGDATSKLGIYLDRSESEMKRVEEQAIAQAASFDWKVIAERTLDVYRAVQSKGH
jgi:glycosyltransferase involved in cell wall biosynthesis